MRTNRRALLKTFATLSLGAASGCRSHPRGSRRSAGRVAIIGGGFAGLGCARALKQQEPALAVTLFEPKSEYVACPLSNLVLAGVRPLARQRFGYGAITAAGIDHRQRAVSDLDPMTGAVTSADGATETFDRVVLATGIEIDHEALPGYDRPAAMTLPHAWQAGAQTTLLRRQLKALPENGLVVMSIPANPYRCPPGPYERASLIAHYLKRHKPRAKLLLLDAKDRFSKQPLFEAAWAQHYPTQLERQGLKDGARVLRVDPKRLELETEFETVRGDVINVIPPQHAGSLARRAGLADQTGWCPIEVPSFRSTLAERVYVIGDAAIANGMPKSAFAANAQGQLAASQIVRDLTGRPPLAPKLLNTCYSYTTPGQAISVADVYRPDDSRWSPVAGAGGTSAMDASDSIRKQEAGHAEAWFNHLTGALFGSR